MSKIDTTLAAPPVRQSRSLHDLFSGFFLNHVGSSGPATVDLVTPFNEGTENEGVSSDPSAPALTFGTHFEPDDLKLLEPTPDVTSFAASSRMRRSETWTSSFQKSTPLLPPSSTSDVTAAMPEVPSTSDVISFTASGGNYNSYTGSGILSFRKSLADIFNPERTTSIDPRDGSSSTGSSDLLSDPDLDTPLTPDTFSRSRHLSLPTLPSESGGHVTPETGNLILSPASPKSKQPLRRESTLSALAETDASSELQRMDSTDINHNAVSPGGATSSTRENRTHARSMSYGGDTKTSVSGALTLPEEFKVLEVRPRRLGILELFEKKTVRNKDVNVMAPQSW